MEKSVAIPLRLLEAILRLLDSFGELDSLNFDNCGYNPRFEYNTALWELKIKIQQLQYHLADTYLLTVGDLTDDEEDALLEWVDNGKSVYWNPWLLYDDSGSPMDFISAYRVADYFDEEPSCLSVDAPYAADDGDWDGGLPF
jgi:hypothetical protein